MADTVSTARRSAMMARVRSKDTRPELAVRRIVTALGRRYRLHHKGLPGKPDLVFAKDRKVIFVHGCFWHQHASCAIARPPKSRRAYWLPKFAGNKARDQQHRRMLTRGGWKILIVRECELKSIDRVQRRIAAFLGKDTRMAECGRSGIRGSSVHRQNKQHNDEQSTGY
ncbi:MAG: very short patch repair endonuclease [Bradyrhizobium sp.]